MHHRVSGPDEIEIAVGPSLIESDALSAFGDAALVLHPSLVGRSGIARTVSGPVDTTNSEDCSSRRCFARQHVAQCASAARSSLGSWCSNATRTQNRLRVEEIPGERDAWALSRDLSESRTKVARTFTLSSRAHGW